MNIVKDSFSNVRGLFTGLMLLLVTVAVSSCSGDHARILPEDCAGGIRCPCEINIDSYRG